MSHIQKEGYKPSYQKSYIQIESITEKAEAARIANGTVNDDRIPAETVERMAKSDKAHLRVTDYDRIRELYEAGMTDGKIAKEMGLVDQSLVRKWRERYGIPEHGNQKRIPKFDRVLAWQMYQDGKNDREIADAMDIDRTQVYQWRKKEGLEPMNKIMADRLKEEIGEEKIPEQDRPKSWDELMADIAELKSQAQDLEPDQDDHPEYMTLTMIGGDQVLPVIEIDTQGIIDEKNAIIQDLLVKNAELAGFIEGVKWAVGRMAG